MAVDDNKLLFSSDWEIDQLVASGTVATSVGIVDAYAIPSGVSLPIFEVQFQPTGSPYWYQCGTFAPTGNLASKQVVYAFIQNNKLKVISSPGTIRYYIWSDKMDY